MIQVNGDTFLVTGAVGFIGSHIVDELLEQGKSVYPFDDFSNSYVSYEDYSRPINREQIQYVPISGKMNFDVVFHEACSKCTVCTKDPFNDLIVNAYGTLKTAKLALFNKAKMVHASTGSINNFMPVSYYGVSKMAGEAYLRAVQSYDPAFRWVALRYHHVYGPRQNAGPNGGVVAIFIVKMLQREPITIFGDGEQTRYFTYVKDVVAANFHAANSTAMEGDYYNVAAGVKVTLNQLVKSLETIIGKKAKVKYLPPKPGDIKHFDVSNKKLSQYGYADWTRLDRGLIETVEWYKEHLSDYP